MEFWLKFNNDAETLWLPVNPESIAVTSPHGFEDVNVSNFGEFTIIGNKQLNSFSVASFFPRDYNASYCAYSDLPDPWETARMIERWQKSGKPARFIVTGAGINVPVTIRNFTYEERGGEPGDVYYTLDMKEYVFLNVAKKSDSTTTAAVNKPPTVKVAAARPSTRETPTSYTVKSGDTLFKIAARVYGDGDQWRKIYDKNKSVIGANPNVIRPGQKLVVPSG